MTFGQKDAIFAAVLTPKSKYTMDKMIEKIAQAEGFSWADAEAKLNLIYHKMNGAEIKSFHDEFMVWLMDEKKMNYKSILQTAPDELHEIFVNEFKK